MRIRWRHAPRTRLRPMTPADGVALDAVFAGLSARSREQRFHGDLPRLAGAARTALLAIDGVHHVGVVAEAHVAGAWQPIGIGRYVVDPSGEEAEVAFEVVDAWQGRGIGRLLLTDLVATARRHGVSRLRALVLPDNVGSLRLLRRVLPDQRVVHAHGALEVVCELELQPLHLSDVLDDLGAISVAA